MCAKLHSQGKAETVVITSGEIGDNPDQIVSPDKALLLEISLRSRELFFPHLAITIGM